MDLVELIAQYLIKVETLTKQDIDEIVETGHLTWYEKQEEERAKLKEATDISSENKEETTQEETKEIKEEPNNNVEYPDEIKLPEDNQENSDETR